MKCAVAVGSLLTLLLSSHLAGAVCQPIGDADDAGCVPGDNQTNRCESGVNDLMSKLVSDLIKCHKKLIAAAFTGANFDEEACETKALDKFDGKAGHLDTCPPCVDRPLLRSEAEAFLDVAMNGTMFCAGSVPLVGDDAGFVPPDKNASTCEKGAAGNAVGLATGLLKCHHKSVNAKRRQDEFDEEACEQELTTGYAAKLAAKKQCQLTPCVNGSVIAAAFESFFDQQSGLIYCAPSP